ncbi:MAG TPA: hypothetical protein VFJ20_05900 [Gemmatimonadaceae bacterium]|nr:hypothetical protein [Gemmatimonadaceae bacterium]
MLRPALLIPRPSSYAVLAAALTLLLAWGGAPPPFAVTFRFGSEVIGPEPAQDLVLPNVAPGGVVLAGGTQKSAAGSSPRLAEIWITLAESAATKRLAELARTVTSGRPVTGTCEISVAGARGKPRRYTVSGCFAKSVDVTGPSRRVTLGYSAINVSE